MSGMGEWVEGWSGMVEWMEGWNGIMEWMEGWSGIMEWMEGWSGMMEWMERWIGMGSDDWIISLEEVAIHEESRCLITAIPSRLYANKHNHPSLLFIARHTLEHTILRQITIKRSASPTKRKPSLTHIAGRDRRGFT